MRKPIVREADKPWPEPRPGACGARGHWLGPLSQKLVCSREKGHKGIHIADLPNVSVGFETHELPGIPKSKRASASP